MEDVLRLTANNGIGSGRDLNHSTIITKTQSKAARMDCNGMGGDTLKQLLTHKIPI